MLVQSSHGPATALAQACQSARCTYFRCLQSRPRVCRGRTGMTSRIAAVPSTVVWNPKRRYVSAAANSLPLPTALPQAARGHVPTDVSIWWDVESCPPPSGVSGAEAVNALYSVATECRITLDDSASWSDADGDFLAFRAYGDWAKRSAGLLTDFQSQPVTLLEAPYEGVSSKLTSDIRLITDVVAFAVAHNARYTSQAGRPPSRKLKLVLVLGTGDYAYTIQRLQQLGHKVVVIMPQPLPTKADASMLSMFSPGSRVTGVQLDWQTDVLQPSLKDTPISGLDSPVEVPFWAPFLQRPSSIGRSAVYPASAKKTGRDAEALLPLVHALQRAPPTGRLWTEAELSTTLGSDVPPGNTDRWTEYVEQAVRAGLIARSDQPRDQLAKGKPAPDRATLVLRPLWYKSLIELKLQSYSTVQSAAAALSQTDMPWTDEQSDLAAWVDDPVSVFGPLVEMLSEAPFARTNRTVEEVQAKLSTRFSVDAAHVAGDEGSYLELAAQAGLLSPGAWERGRVRLADEWWTTLYRLSLAALLRPKLNTNAPLAGVASTGAQAIVTADLARPFIDAVTHFHQMGTMKPVQAQLRRWIADREPSIYRRAGVGGWDDYIRRLQDADLVFDDGNTGVSLQNFWYVTLVKLELVASGSLAHAVAAEAARAEKSVPWSPFQAKVVNQTPDPLKALVPFIGQMLFAQRGGRQIPSTAEALRPLINAKAYRLARLAPNNFRAYLDMAKDSGILSHDQSGGYFLIRNWWSAFYRVHLAALARAHGLA